MPRYSANQKQMRGLKSGKPQFVMVYRSVKRSTAYHNLGHLARSLLFELIDRYTGCNNGMIGLGVREAAYELRCSKGGVSKAMRQLDDAGLARPTKLGEWRGRHATEWRLTWLRCDKTGELPVTQWHQHKPYSEFTQNDAKVRPEVHANEIRVH
jgi:hypothetical protein